MTRTRDAEHKKRDWLKGKKEYIYKLKMCKEEQGLSSDLGGQGWEIQGFPERVGPNWFQVLAGGGGRSKETEGKRNKGKQC